MKGTRWSREDTIIAYALYCIIPLSEMRLDNMLIQQVAAKIPHSASSLIMCMQNYRHIDTNVKTTGLSHVGKTSKAVFEEFRNDWGQLSVLAEELTGLSLFDATPKQGAHPLSALTNRSKTNRERQFFRASVLSNFEDACCLSGCKIPSLLIASHIKPYHTCRTELERVSPENDLCLNCFYDKAFDSGLITITPNLIVHVSPQVKMYHDTFTREWLTKIDGNKIVSPSKFSLAKNFLEYHNDVIFKGVG